MLLQFTFNNYKSFKDETTLDMMATSIKDHESDVATDAYGERVLKVAAIFGANASGKSNIFKAFRFMNHFVRRSFIEENEVSLGLEVEPFKFISQTEPSSFEVVFNSNENTFQYGFTMDNEKVYEEYLYIRDIKFKKEKYITLFYRDQSGITELSKEFDHMENLLELLDKRTLFLTLTSKLKIGVAKQVFEWFRDTNIIDYGNDFNDRLLFSGRGNNNSQLIQILKDDNRKKALEVFIKAIDVGIEKFELKEQESFMNSSELPPINLKSAYQILTLHKNIDNNEYSFNSILNESSGTQKMIALYVSVSKTLQQGSVLFVDELDAKLHPLLLRYLINMFHDPEINPNKAQLIFTTHDVFTLDKDNFRRDEIWFVDKDDRGISELYSLAEYKLENGKKPRNDASYGKDYILGKYNAIPDLKPISKEDF